MEEGTDGRDEMVGEGLRGGGEGVEGVFIAVEIEWERERAKGLVVSLGKSLVDHEWLEFWVLLNT